MDIAIRNSAGGIGDAVCGAYVAQSIKHKFPNKKVVYFTHQPHWLMDVEGISIRPYSEFLPYEGVVYDLNHNYNKQLSEMHNRKQWYAKAVPIGMHIQPPRLRRTYSASRAGNHIILNPYTHWKGRNWNTDHWALLEQRLLDKGYDVVVMGTPSDKSGEKLDYSMFKSRTMINKNHDQVIDTVLKAKCVVGNDSGLPHLSGMYGVPTVAITSQIHSNRLFSGTSVKGVMPVGWSCMDCGYGHRKKLHGTCGKVCAALQEISVKQVEHRILTLLSVGGTVVEGKLELERG